MRPTPLHLSLLLPLPTLPPLLDLRPDHQTLPVLTTIVRRVLIDLNLLENLQRDLFFISLFLQFTSEHLAEVFFFDVAAAFVVKDEFVQVAADCAQHILGLVETRFEVGVELAGAAVGGVAFSLEAVGWSYGAALLRELFLFLVIVLPAGHYVLVPFMPEEIIVHKRAFPHKRHIQIRPIPRDTILKLQLHRPFPLLTSHAEQIRRLMFGEVSHRVL